MTTPLPSDRASTKSSATSTNDTYDDALSHADTASFGTPTAQSRPDTPRQHTVAGESEETPRPVSTTILKQVEAAQTASGREGTLTYTPTVRRTAVHSPADDKTSTSEEDEKEAERHIAQVGAENRSSTGSRYEVPTETIAERSARASVAPIPAAAQSKEADGNTTERETPNATAEDDSLYLTGVKLYLLTIGLFFATFVIALDNTIIATAIPKITADFNSLDDVGWYGSSYLLTTTALQPSFGKVYSYFDVKWTYILAVIIFEVGSVVCATAPNSTALIVGRAVAGLGAAGLFSGGITIVGYSVPLRRRAMYIAIISSTFGIASIVGPILGGLFTDSFLGWPFCFWINLPVGGIAVVTTGLFFTSPPRRNTHLSPMEKLRQMDLAGAFVLICAICCLLLALQWGGITYPWHDSRVWGTLLGFGLLIIGFIALQVWMGDHATIPLRIISNRGVAVGTAFSMAMNWGIFIHVFYYAFYQQACKGTTAEESGIRSIPYLVSNTLASIVVGTCVTVFGPYTPYLWFGSAVFTVGAGMLDRLQVDSSPAVWIGYQLIAGIGAGIAIQIPFIAVQALLDPADMPTGNALTIFFNTLGGAFSVSVGQNIFSNELAKQLEASVPPLVIEIVSLAGATGIREAVPPQYLPAVLQSYNDAVTRTFIVPIVTGGIAFLISLWMPWGTVKGKNLLTGAA